MIKDRFQGKTKYLEKKTVKKDCKRARFLPKRAPFF